MLRRFLIAMLMIGLTAGVMAPGQATSVGMDCEQLSTQLHVDCDTAAMAGTPCSVPCPAGACAAPALLQRQAIKALPEPLVRPAAQASDSALPPDTAPPKQPVL